MLAREVALRLGLSVEVGVDDEGDAVSTAGLGMGSWVGLIENELLSPAVGCVVTGEGLRWE